MLHNRGFSFVSGALCILAGGGRSLGVKIDPTTLYGASSNLPIRVGPSTATVTGGVGPFSYHWESITGGSQIVADNPFSYSTNFTGVGISSGEVVVSYFRMTVTDNATGLQAVAPSWLEVTIERLL